MGRQRVKRYKSEDRILKKSPAKTVEDKYTVSITPEDSILVIIRKMHRSADSKQLKVSEFTVINTMLFQNNWIHVRKHCWMKHTKDFHTHIRTGLGKRRWRKVILDEFESMEDALNWSKKDMYKNYNRYRKSLLTKLVK